MSTNTWTDAPAGYLKPQVCGARLFDRVEAGRGVAPLAPIQGSGLPAVGRGVPMRTAAPFGTHLSGVVTVGIAVDDTTLGIPSSRRPSS